MPVSVAAIRSDEVVFMAPLHHVRPKSSEGQDQRRRQGTVRLDEDADPEFARQKLTLENSHTRREFCVRIHVRSDNPVRFFLGRFTCLPPRR